MNKPIILLGYSGHAYEVIEICHRNGLPLLGYCEEVEKESNPYGLNYLGFENDEGILDLLRTYPVHISIGSNQVRSKIYKSLEVSGIKFKTIVDSTSLLSSSIFIGAGSLVGKGSKINAFTNIGNSVICNTGSIIEHECSVGDFCHIGPGAILCGGVEIGDCTLIGAGAVVLPNIIVGKNVVVGAGSLVNKNVPSNKKVVGNPSKEI